MNTKQATIETNEQARAAFAAAMLARDAIEVGTAAWFAAHAEAKALGIAWHAATEACLAVGAMRKPYWWY